MVQALLLLAQVAQVAFLFITRRKKMAKFAVIHNNIVSNVIICDTKEIAEALTNTVCVEYTEENPASIGWKYDADNNTFIQPIIEESSN